MLSVRLCAALLISLATQSNASTLLLARASVEADFSALEEPGLGVAELSWEFNVDPTGAAVREQPLFPGQQAFYSLFSDPNIAEGKVVLGDLEYRVTGGGFVVLDAPTGDGLFFQLTVGASQPIGGAVFGDPVGGRNITAIVLAFDLPASALDSTAIPTSAEVVSGALETRFGIVTNGVGGASDRAEVIVVDRLGSPQSINFEYPFSSVDPPPAPIPLPAAIWLSLASWIALAAAAGKTRRLLPACIRQVIHKTRHLRQSAPRFVWEIASSGQQSHRVTWGM